MYGLIHQGFKDMVCLSHGEDVWREICGGISREPGDYDPLASYPDAETFRLLEAVTQRLELSHEEVLRRFGRYWIRYTALEGYGPILDLFGKDFSSCLKNLNRMHGHMGAMMPNLKPPRFEVKEHDSRGVTLHYFSSRKGLAPMVHGLLEGLSDRFNEPISIDYFPQGERSDHDEFDIFFESK
jgi:hypothetical protein